MDVKNAFSKAKTELNKFFNGTVYPLIVGALILLSHIFGIEFYLNFANVLMCALAFIVSDSVKPFIPVLCTYVYQFSRETNISNPSADNFYFGGAKLYVIIILFCLAILAAAYFFIKRGRKTLEGLRELPLLLSFVILSSAFLLNGAFSGAWSLGSFGFGAVQVATFFVIFYFFVIGLRDEGGEELAGYLAYVTAIMAFILFAETVYLYVSGDLGFENGSVVKDTVYYGWGIWNTAGQQMVMTIPMLFYGVMKKKNPWVYFALAILMVLSATLTLSRNALIFAVLTFAAMAVVCLFYGQVKKQFRVILPVGVLLLALCVLVFWGKISGMLSDYLERGLSDNGRFDLWGRAIDAFLEAPIFGKGFFGAYPPEFQDGGIFPWMAHNTVVELLGAMGIFGFGAYIFYRVCTVRTFVIRPTLTKTLLGVSMLTVIAGSLLDNFLFYYHQMLYYPLAYAIAYKLSEEQKKKETAELPEGERM